MPVDEHRAAAQRSAFGFAVITASDTRTPEKDLSGALARQRLEAAGHRVLESILVRDDAGLLRAAVAEALAAKAVDAVVVTGGTGFAPRDVTIEALAPLFDKTIDGFGELFRRLSFDQIGPAAMLSRATAGITAGKAIFLVPGSPAAVDLALSALVLPEIAHLLGQARRAS